MDWYHFASGAFTMLGVLCIGANIYSRRDARENRLINMENKIENIRHSIEVINHRENNNTDLYDYLYRQLGQLRSKVDSIKVPCSKK